MFFRFAVLPLAIILFWGYGCAPQSEKSPSSKNGRNTEKLKILATVEPIAWLADRIGSDRIQTEVLVNAGKEPETFTPSPKKTAALTENKIFFRVGIVSEQTLLPKIKANAPGMKIIDLRENLDLIPAHDHHDQPIIHSEHASSNEKSSEFVPATVQKLDSKPDLKTVSKTGSLPLDEHTKKFSSEHELKHKDPVESEHEHESENAEQEHQCGEDGLDPHFWMSPQLTSIAVNTMTEALVEADPAGSAEYKKNAALLLKDLDTLRKEIQKKLMPFQGRTILVFHPAYGYYCREFGLNQLAVEAGGKAPKPKMISDLIAKTKKERIHLLIVQPEFNRESAESVAEAADLKTALHSPLIADYFQNLNELTDLIAASLSD